MFSTNAAAVQATRPRGDLAPNCVQCGRNIVNSELESVQDLYQDKHACCSKYMVVTDVSGNRTETQPGSTNHQILPTGGHDYCCIPYKRGLQTFFLNSNCDGTQPSETIPGYKQSENASSEVKENVLQPQIALGIPNRRKIDIGKLWQDLSSYGFEEKSFSGSNIYNLLGYKVLQEGDTATLFGKCAVLQLLLTGPSNNVSGPAPNSNGGCIGMQGWNILGQSTANSYMVQGDIDWADEDFVDGIKEDFPFLQKNGFKPLPSLEDFFIFQSGNQILGYFQEACTIYFLGNLFDEAWQGFEPIAKYGWGHSSFWQVDNDTGKVLEDGLGLSGERFVITKKLAQTTGIKDLLQSVNCAIEEAMLI